MYPNLGECEFFRHYINSTHPFQSICTMVTVYPPDITSPLPLHSNLFDPTPGLQFYSLVINLLCSKIFNRQAHNKMVTVLWRINIYILGVYKEIQMKTHPPKPSLRKMHCLSRSLLSQMHSSPFFLLAVKHINKYYCINSNVARY